MKNEFDANRAMISACRNPHRQIYAPAKAAPPSWWRAAGALLVCCAAGAGFAYVLTVFLAGG